MVLACGLIFSSCDLVNGDFLDRSARGAVSEDVLAGKHGGIDALLTGAYSALSGQSDAGGALGGGAAWAASPNNWIFGSVAGGMAHKGSSLDDQEPIRTIGKHQHGPNTGFVNHLWKARYEGVNRANSVLRLLPKIEGLSEQEKTRFAAEARFLRGHFYFDLKRNFGNVPWIDETTEELKQPNTGADHPDVWQKIEEDFQFAMNNLPETPPDAGRVNRWAAAAYLAKTHLYQEEWQGAKSLFDQVINQGVTSRGQSYALTPRYQDMFNAATEGNSGEVFSIHQAGPDGSANIANARGGDVLNYPDGGVWVCCGFFTPSLWFVNSFRVGPDGLPLSFDPAEGPNVKHDQGVPSNEQFTLGNQTLDPRLDWTVGRRGLPFHDWGPHPGAKLTQTQSESGAFAPKKHIFRRVHSDQFGTKNSWGAHGSGLDYKIIRFADVLLMAAEAEAQLGNLEPARQYVNRVRERAANPEGELTNALNEEFALAVVDNEAAMLATEAVQDEWVVRTDRNSTFQLIKGDPGDIANWNEYQMPDYDVAPYPASEFNASQEAALQRIRFERKLELGMEGHRFYDLVRWDLADERLDAYYAFENDNLVPDVQGGDFTPGKNEVYPIPQRQIDLSFKGGESVLEQNSGY